MAGLNLRQRKYVEGIVDGKTKKQAAVEAGYSTSTAENAAAIIEGPDVRAAFEKLIRRNVDPNKIVQRLTEVSMPPRPSSSSTTDASSKHAKLSITFGGANTLRLRPSWAATMLTKLKSQLPRPWKTGQTRN